MRRLSRRLEEAFPGLSQILGDRLDLQLPALGSSLGLHLLLLLVLMFVVVQVRSNDATELQTAFTPAHLEDFESFEDQALAELENTRIEPVAGSLAPHLATTPVEALPDTAGKPKQDLSITSHEVKRMGSLILPQASALDRNVSIRGSGAEHTGDVEGAVDRLAVEILRRLERGPTLVVWMFDASGSLLEERQRLAQHIEKVYDHIETFDRERLASDGGLLTTVIAFGQDRKLLIDQPTDDRQAILAAIARVPLDESGIENTFSTVVDVARRFGRYKRDERAYQTMPIIVTDEVGDDDSRLEEAITLCRQFKLPVYILGSPALFGRIEGYVNYTDPKTGQTYFNLPVRQGPESVTLETFHLPFWYDGPQFEVLDAGFGPYALSRLAAATGGIYFIARMHDNRITFDPRNLAEYRPDWTSREQYLAAVARNPLRQAVIQAATFTREQLPGQPSFQFPALESPDFKDFMARNQEIVSRVQYTVDEALQVIQAVASRRDHETSRRWKAHYDLLRGRLLAMRVRCLEYNLACAKIRRDMPKFTKPKSNTWRLQPATELALKDKTARAQAEEAWMLLERVVKDHPGTPWALLAQRELKDPLGLAWVESYVPPPPPAGENNAPPRNRNQNRTPPANPAAPPKL